MDRILEYWITEFVFVTFDSHSCCMQLIKGRRKQESNKANQSLKRELQSNVALTLRKMKFRSKLTSSRPL